MTFTAKQICLTEFPQGLPTAQTFNIASVDVPAPKDGEVRVRNLYMSVDPYMRGRMTGVRSYADPYELGKPMTGGAVGEIMDSAHPDFKAGDHVLTMRGWREGFTADIAQLRKTEMIVKVDTNMIPAPAYLGVAGMPGLTAYAGLYDVAKFTAKDTVLVSGAAGAVGSTVCQLAKAEGAYVVGIAVQGFIVTDHAHLQGDDIAKLGPLMAAGKLKQMETVVDGIDQAPSAFLRLFSGDKQGKMLVKLT